MLAGLPIIGFTWYVQRTAHHAYTATPTFTPGGTPSMQGTLATMAMRASPHVSWRRTWMGGAVAVGAFAVLVIGFMVMRALGIGPAGSLIGKGAFGNKETLIIADFRAPGDSTLGQTIAEALRTDLGQSASLNVMTKAAVRDILRLMQRPIESLVTFDVAREIASREGAKAVLDGEVSRLGQTYVVSARLVSSIDGAELAKFGQTASGEDALIAALGKLSRDIRGKIGESLKDIRDTKALERVTTPSLTALRKYVEGNRLIDEVGNDERGLELLYEAVGIDSGFAMAWRKIAVVLNNNRTQRPRAIDAASRAFQNRERLSETERLLTEAFYYTVGPTPDRDKVLAAYQSLLEADSNNTTASNNAGVMLDQKREYAKARELYALGVKSPRPLGISFTNLMVVQLRMGDVAAVESTQALFRQRMPGQENLWQGEWNVRWGKWDLAAADSVALAAFRATQRVQPQRWSAASLAGSAYLRGKVRDGLRWKSEENKAIYRGTHADEQLIIAAVDSALMVSFFLGKSAEGQQIIRRALTRTPLSGLRPAARPWNRLGELSSIMRDRQLAADVIQGYEKDLDQLGVVNPEADRSRMQAWVAMAESRYDDAIRGFHEADRALAMYDRRAMIALADAYDLAGRSDSALVYYQRFLDSRDALPGPDGLFRAGAYKRAGELYEARGDTAKAEANYTKFIELWKDADPELQPKVQEVRERLTRLRRGKG
jgi:tetratricopeptide (TPR) repeat protein